MEEFMESLWSSLPSKLEDAKTTLHRIIQYLNSGLTSEERDLSLHLMFEEERGMQSFLKAIGNTDMRKFSSDVLCFFSFLLEWYTPSLENYVVSIKNIAVSFIYNRASAATEKEKALDVLIGIITRKTWIAGLELQPIINHLLSMASHRVSKPTVLRKVYCLIGVIAREYPYDVNPKSQSLLKALMMDLDHQVTLSQKVEFTIIEGCFDGLSSFLIKFPLNELANTEKNCNRLACYLMKVLKVTDVHRKTAARAGLNLLAGHGGQLENSLVSQYQEWHRLLNLWLGFEKEERKYAKQALLTFYRVLACHILSQENTKEVLDFFCKHLKSLFEMSQNVDIAVKGFGLFAKAMKQFMPEEIPVVFNILAQRSHEECGRGNHHKIADYLDSLSVFTSESGVIHNLQLAILEGLSVQLICQFAQEEQDTWREVMADSVVSTLIRLSRCSGSALDLYMNTVVHQGIIRSVSHPVVEDAKILHEAGQEKVTTYENYLPFWQALLSMNLSSKISMHQDLDEQRCVSRKLVDTILESIIEIITRLDLTLQENLTSEPSCQSNVEKCIEANSPQDFTVLVNLVNFTIALLNNLSDQCVLSKWISPLIVRTIRLSSRHPLISSFYKLLANTVLIAEKLGYFDEQRDEMEDVEWKPTVNLLSGFLYDVIARQSQYQGDLQVACLHLMLAIPSCIAAPLLRDCATAFQSVFRLGCGMLSLAQEGLRTLSKWNQDIPGEKMKTLLQAVLPSFDILLQTKDSVADEDNESSLTGMAMVRKVLQDQKKGRLWKQKANAHVDTELALLQKEVILFLSTLDSSTCLSLLDGSEEKMGGMAWQEQRFLTFPLPFPDAKVELSLDDMLPRLSDLAVSCSDRQTRSAACELLHAVIMFMLGKEKQLEQAQEGRLTCLWTHLFPKVLRLACDVDSLVSQLFAPLGEQMAHWYSSRTHENSPQSAAFLEALFDGVCHRTDAALRDYAARCLHEYVSWAKKQGRTRAKLGPVAKRLWALCLHPCPVRRMGAALTFNGLYAVLREDADLVDEYWIELVYGLVNGLAMCSATGEDGHAEVQLENSLRHVPRVFVRFANKFNNVDSARRRIPAELSGGRLYHVVKWLLQYCTALNAACRRACRALVDELAKYVTDCRSISDFILRVEAVEGNAKLVEIIECNNGLRTELPNETPWDMALAWVYSLLASMECYMWLLEMKVPPEVLYKTGNCKLHQALSHFLGGVVLSKVDQTSLWRPKAMENFNSAKCFTIVRMIEYLTVVLEKRPGAVLDSFWSLNFWEVLIDCCLCPSHVGFDSSSKTVGDNLPSTIEKFLKTLAVNGSEHVVEDLKQLLNEKISSLAPALLERFSASVRDGRVLAKDRDLVRGLKVLQTVFEETQLWSGLVDETSLQLVFQSIVEPISIAASDQSAPVELSPVAAEYSTSMLQLYFTTTTELRPLFKCAADTSLLHRRGLQGDLTHGEHFLSCFETVIVEMLMEHPRESVNILEELLCLGTSPRGLTVLLLLLKSNFHPNSHKWFCLQKLVKCIFSTWPIFVTWTQDDSGKETWLISLLTQIVKLNVDLKNMENCGNVCTWVVQLLNTPSRSLALKTDLLLCLPIVCSSPRGTDIKTCLQNLKDTHFPSMSSEFKSGSEELLTFKRAFEALLHSLVITGDQTILHIVIKMMTVDPHHVCHHLLPKTLENLMRQLQTKTDGQVQSLVFVYSIFDNEVIDVECRMRILNDFLLKLMQFASIESQEKFAIKIIKNLVQTIKQNVGATKDVGRARQKLLTHIASWDLLRIIYGFPLESLCNGKGSELVKAAFFGTDTVVINGKELTALLTRRALDAFQNPLSFENFPTELTEMCRKYLCAVYNMLATLVCNLKIDPADAKFYDKFLFDDKSKKIWRLLVNSTKCYMLPFQLTEHLKKVEKAVSIRRNITEEGRSAEKHDIHQNLKILESQTYAGSLGTDISRFDFTHSRLLNPSVTPENDGEKSIVVLENDTLNDHECMATVCGVIRHLVDSGISPIPKKGAEIALPGWMGSLRTSLLDQTNPRNSHIFILRNLLENGISYLLGDIIFLLSKWSSENPSVNIDTSQSNRLLCYVVENCADPLRTVFKYHLELIKSILEVWKEHMDPPHELLLRMLQNSDKKVGINLTAIMLWYDLIPWTVESKKAFLSFLENNLQSSTKEIFKASSETLGLCLKHLSSANNGNLLPDDECFADHLIETLNAIRLKQRDPDRFLTVLLGVHESYPQIVDSFIPVILFHLDQSTDDKKALCLSLLLVRLELVGEHQYQELHRHGLLAMTSDRNPEVQIKAFQILVKLAPSLQDSELYEVIHEISLAFHFVKGEARYLLHELSWISFDQYSPKPELSDIERKIYDESKALLLSGLVDPTLELQKKCFLKWTEEDRLPTHAQERLFNMFSLMYSPLIEQHFLSYSVPLMLEGTTCTPDFLSAMFAHALDDCTFEPHIVNPNQSNKYAGMIPMFAQTLASQMSQLGSQNTSFDSSYRVLATQASLIFQPTADLVDGSINSKSQFDTGKSIARSSFLFSQDGGSNSSQGSPFSLNVNFKQGQGFGTRRLRFTDDQGSPESQTRGSGSSLKLNRYMGRNTAGMVFGKANVRKAKARETAWNERIRKREAVVSLSRKYRKGDLPDIQIKVSDLINPLKELCKRDTTVAKKVMVNLFVGLRKIVDEDNPINFGGEAETLLNGVLEKSTSYEPSTIGVCLEIAYHCQFNLKPDKVHEAAIGSDLLALGSLLLEKTAVNENEDVWVHLAELYDGLGERAVAHSILLHNVTSLGNKSKAALAAHAERQWMKAKKLYYEALPETQYDSFYESCFECMAVLSEWDNINKVIREEVDQELDNLWAVTWYERKLLPRLLHSEVLSLINEGRDAHQFWVVMNLWLKDELKGVVLKDRFSDILSILCIIKKTFAQSRFFGSKTLSRFIDQWRELSPLFRKRRELSLMRIHKSAEVMGFFSEGKELLNAEDCIPYIKKVQRVLPSLQDSLMEWEARISYRVAFLKCLTADAQGEVQKCTLNMQLKLVETALQQQNHNFAKKYLSTMADKVEFASPAIKTRWLLAQCLERHQWAEKEQNAVKCLYNLLKIWISLDSIVATDIKSCPELSVTAHSAESNLSLSIRQLILQDPDSLLSIKENSVSNYNWLCKKLMLQAECPSDHFVESLESIGLNSLMHSKQFSVLSHSENRVRSDQITEAFLKIAQYCRKILDSKDPNSTEVTYSRHLVKAILSAMKYGSAQARQLFPLLLQLPAISSDLSKDFKEKSDSVPVWMFLSWIPQIVAMLDSAVDLVGPLLLKIARKYPNAVSYPYNISRETNEAVNPLTSNFIKQLDAVLESSSLHSRLVRALSCLTHPSVILHNCLTKLQQIIGLSPVNWESMEKICESFEEILNCSPGSFSQSMLTGNFFESIHKENIGTLFQELKGGIEKRSTKVVKAILEKIRDSKGKVENIDKRIKKFSKLKDFSPWLANFSSSKMEDKIEIPGQYSGDQKPSPERHIMISRFEDTVQVMPSIRKPVKLTIIGSDASSHHFLVKNGEDLRQDERVQQLLSLMNGIFSRSHLCKESHLSLVTYKVVPLSDQLGIIGWVEETSSLRELMQLPLDEGETMMQKSILGEFHKWLNKAGVGSIAALYGLAHNNVNRQDSIAQFSKLVSMVKQDVLRRALELWSSSAEAFYWLRHSFISSYSTMCIAHWLLGIGDRHTQNCLISKENGLCIGIDFGHAFGSATEFLPIPELIPFRMTPHIVNVVQPHGTTGVIQETMVSVLRALQSDSEVLLATMQVFIQEPSVDWLNYARKHLADSKEDPQWLPVRKVQQAKRKLQGVNPVVIVKEDLESKSGSDYHPGFCRTLMGNPQYNTRARLAEDGLTPRQQVECLLDLATDPNVLLKTYCGWEPWL